MSSPPPDPAPAPFQASPGSALSQLLRGSLVTQLIHVVATLGIADLLEEGPRSSHDLAAAVGADADALYRVLRALASFGVFTETGPGSFALTSLAEPLRSRVPGSLRASAMLYGQRWWWHACGELLHSVRTGQTAFEHVHGQALFAYLDQAGAAAATFNDHQTSMTRQDASAVVGAYDFTECPTVVDVGGGHGALSAAIAEACPHTRVILFDQPSVIAGAQQALRDAGVSERCTCVAGDFFRAVPEGALAYVLKDVVHDWDDEQAIAILANCRRAMAGHPSRAARLLLIEKVIPPGDAPFAGKLTDITMLLIAGGRERTAQEYQALLARAGFAVQRIVPTRSPASIVEAFPAAPR